MKRASCQKLGFCQAMAECDADDLAECHMACTPPPGPNRHPFAPGVIDGPKPLRPGALAADVLMAMVGLAMGSAAVGFLVGHVATVMGVL